MKQIYQLTAFLLFTFFASAQQSELKGSLFDSLRKEPVSNATVSLINQNDSSLEAFTRTNDLGEFNFKKLKNGSYRLALSHVNFHPGWKNIVVSGATALEPIAMKDKSLMADVTVVAARPPVVINGDTLEFNAESFKTKPNAVVEDMLRKMPGVEVGSDGSIRVNGRPINRVMVNGRDFFNGDPKMATRNLPADAIDKVQVFDKLSDQSAFTGVDDGNSEKTINLKLKKDRNNAVFGKAGIAASNDERYDGQFNLNKFNGTRQVSAIGMSNNTNRQGFSLMDMLNFTGQNRRMMSGGGGVVINTGGPEDFGLPVAGINNNQGMTQTSALGLNYADNWNKKSDVNASYFYNNLNFDNQRNSSRLNFGNGNPFTTNQNSSTDSRTESHRLNLSFDHRIDSFNSIKWTSLLGSQKGNALSESGYSSLIAGNEILNNGSSKYSNSTEGETFNNILLLRHKFPKKGRTISLNANMQYNNSRGKGLQNTMNDFYTGGTITERDTINQMTNLKSLTYSYGSTLTYTEPLSKRSLIELRGFYNKSYGSLDRNAFDYNNGTTKHDLANTALSNAFENDHINYGAGLGFRMQQKKLNLSVGANIQQSTLDSRSTDNAFRVEQKFTNLLPMANLNYQFARMKSLRFDYTSSVSQPSATQLQPVLNINDPLNLKIGNPSLKQEYIHSLNLQFINANPGKQSNLFAFINYANRQNAIVNSDQVNASGIRTSMPVNTDGVYSLQSVVEKGFRVKDLNTRFGVGVNGSYNRSANFINGEKNKSTTIAAGPRISAEYNYKEKFNLNVVARYSFNQATYSLQNFVKNEYGRQQLNIESFYNFKGNWTLASDLAYNKFTGREQGFNTSNATWNASLSKLFLKSKKAELKLSVYDILKQQQGIDRNANANYIEDIQFKTLQRYFTLGFTYSLQRTSTGGPRAVIRTF